MNRSLSKVFLSTGVFGMLFAAQADGAGAFLFANASQRNRISHPMGYNGGNNQHLIITVGILPGSPNSNQMIIPLENAIRTWTELEGALPNVFQGSGTGIPSGHFDFESVLLHEIGHGLGMAHPNLASESGLGTQFHDYTKSTTGINGVYDLNAGADGVLGSRLDIRGDDLPLVWFEKATNNPFTNPGVVDSTTFSQDIDDLPPGDSYVANGSLPLSPLLGIPPAEVVLQQGTRSREAQRQLTPGCVALVRLARAGYDRIQGTSDDYTFELQYVGITTNAHITVGFDNAQTQFAVTSISANVPLPDHRVLTSSRIYFNTGWNWYFNQTSNAPDLPETSDTWAIH